ncbi:hypothetical protein [Halapricum hydrolyticum]|uniref:Uncharacterized protein n=1 Tax=Halapricum hydrolyticum TaxID=2979991 RepID=A0AAE3IE66_9EURY|nr:hypothetical protein [Halapricum hydrolyticum]MCU4719468.1 hypothetical protein [Halapricum hydrolyticum]MCU4728079.1 hypothetical protein [Halapricum hydrolyticum]
MRETIERVFGLDRFSRRLIALGVVLVVGSLALAGWFLLSGELVTGLSILLYVVVGTLLAAIGFSPSVGSGPNQRV